MTDASAFQAFFEKHHAELSRLAYLLIGDPDGADDLTADAMVEVWRHWNRVEGAEQPLAYARRIVVGLARNRIRPLPRKQARLGILAAQERDRVENPDIPAVADSCSALDGLPYRRRACVVLRYAFDLSKQETAHFLGVSEGTVERQTSRGVAQLDEASP